MTALAAALASLASLAGLAAWAQAVPTRALEATPTSQARRRACWSLPPLLLLQCAAAVTPLGWAGGLFTIACAWQLLGAAFVLAWNTWPQATCRWSARLGGCALAGALVLALS